MLKTLGNIKSITRPKKGKVKFGDNGSDNDSYIDGGSCSGNFDMNLSDTPKLMCSSTLLISMLKTTSSIDLSTSATQIVVEYNEIDDDGDCSDDFNQRFHPRLCMIATPLTSMLKTSSSTAHQIM